MYGRKKYDIVYNSIYISVLMNVNKPRSYLLTWLHLIVNLEGFTLNITQVLGGRAWEALESQFHVLLPDGQGTVQTFAGQLKVIQGHLKYT